VLSVRPKVAELAFQLYSRSLHPELFEIHRSRVVEREGYRVKIDVTSAGHVITWQHQGLTLTEVACSAHHPLPQKRRLMSHRLKGQQSDQIDCRSDVSYECDFILEPVEPELFWTYQNELCQQNCEGMLHQFDSSGRMALGALSYVYLETRLRTLSVQVFHTFPDDCAIVKSQSIFRLPS